MALKDRCKINGNKFYVLEDEDASEKVLYYKKFSIEDALDDVSGLEKLSYVKTGFGVSNTVKELDKIKETFVLLVEKDINDKILDEHRFYYPGIAEKGELWIRRTKNRAFGKNAYTITISWKEDDYAEDINSQYIYLQDQKGGKYYFLSDKISAVNGRKIPEDCFVFELPEGDSINNYQVKWEPLLKEKYDIYYEEKN